MVRRTSNDSITDGLYGSHKDNCACTPCRLASVYNETQSFEAVLHFANNNKASQSAKELICQRADSFDSLYYKAKIKNDECHQQWGGIINTFGGVYIQGPLKDRARCLQKINCGNNEHRDRCCYRGDHKRLLDIVRGSGVFRYPSDLLDCLNGFKKFQSYGWRVFLQDRFNKPTRLGYRDLKLNLVSDAGFVGELQLHLDGFYQIKTYLHRVYERVRVVPVVSGNPIAANGDKERVLVEARALDVFDWGSKFYVPAPLNRTHTKTNSKVSS